MNRVGIETDGLTVSVVMSGESGPHVLECGTVVDGRVAVGFITGTEDSDNRSWLHNDRSAYSQGSIK